MNNDVMKRKIDELGRIVIPKEIRKKFHITKGQKLNIFIKNKNVILGIDTSQENGILGTIDELGRIVIFCQIREKANLEVGEELNIYTKRNEIILQKQVRVSA